MSVNSKLHTDKHVKGSCELFNVQKQFISGPCPLGPIDKWTA